MDAVRKQVIELQDGWKTVYETLLTNPAVAAPHLETISAEQINEVIETVVWWFNRAKAPKGFAPRFHLAEAVTSTSLSAALTALKSIQGGQYNFLPSLITALNQVMSGLHTLLASSESGEVRDNIASLGTELSEKLALIDTAQRELKTKVDTLKDASTAADEIASKTDTMKQNHDSAVAALKEITATQTKANEVLEAIKQDEEDTTGLRDAAAEIQKQSNSLAEKLKGQSEILAKLQEDSQKQSEKITALLPKGASAGLASSFATRVGQLELAKWMWVLIFSPRS